MGDTPLHCAVRQGNLPIGVIQSLLHSDAGCALDRTTDGKSPLQLALSHLWFSPRVAKELMQAQQDAATDPAEVCIQWRV